MRNLLLLFLRYGGFLIFGALEILSFYLIVQYNQGQQVIFQNTINNFTARYDQTLSNISEYSRLRRENDQLHEANKNYYQQLLNLQWSANLSAPDSTNQAFKLLPAEVVSNSIDKYFNYLVINRGSRDSVEAGMGVIADNGVVGIVRGVSPNYAIVMSLLHRQMKPSVAIKRNGYFGSLSWKGGNPKKAQLDNIPKHANPLITDTIVTSGYSFTFPPDIPVGRVNTYTLDLTTDIYEIEVDLFIDMANIQRVYVVRHQHLDQWQQLQKEVPYE